MSAGERAELERELGRSRQQLGQRNQMLLGPALTLILLLAGLWALLDWAARKFLDLDVGLRSAAAPWMFLAGVLILLGLIGPEILKTHRRSKEVLGGLAADLASGAVDVETMTLTDAMRFQEPEHGGFLYFLRTNDGQVYVQFDQESQDLGVNGQDPALSRYLPRRVLTIVRAPRSAHIVACDFTGDPVHVPETNALGAPPSNWPEPDTFCKTPWPELKSTYGA